LGVMIVRANQRTESMMTPEIEYWWIRREGSLTLAEIYVHNGVPIEAHVTGVEEPVHIHEADLVAKIKKPAVIVAH